MVIGTIIAAVGSRFSAQSCSSTATKATIASSSSTSAAVAAIVTLALVWRADRKGSTRMMVLSGHWRVDSACSGLSSLRILRRARSPNRHSSDCCSGSIEAFGVVATVMEPITTSTFAYAANASARLAAPDIEKQCSCCYLP